MLIEKTPDLPSSVDITNHNVVLLISALAEVFLSLWPLIRGLDGARWYERASSAFNVMEGRLAVPR